jgi:Co/Zn/Cd efflux system component
MMWFEGYYTEEDEDAVIDFGRSAWICSRNDVLGNLAVLLAALGVFGTGTLWPDVVVAMAMATLALQGSVTVIKQSLDELNSRQSLVVEEGR